MFVLLLVHVMESLFVHLFHLFGGQTHEVELANGADIVALVLLFASLDFLGLVNQTLDD